jgi:hypothetical protein
VKETLERASVLADFLQEAGFRTDLPKAFLNEEATFNVWRPDRDFVLRDTTLVVVRPHTGAIQLYHGEDEALSHQVRRAIEKSDLRSWLRAPPY